MNKLEVQKRVSKNGSPLDLDLFDWDEETKTFSSSENDLVINFEDVDDCTLNAGADCVFLTGNNCKAFTRAGCL